LRLPRTTRRRGFNLEALRARCPANLRHRAVGFKISPTENSAKSAKKTSEHPTGTGLEDFEDADQAACSTVPSRHRTTSSPLVIVSLHVATGAGLGALTGSRLAALALGPALHLACDRVPHEDIADRRFETHSGLFGLALLALGRGPLDPATLGAASASAPDLEHIFPRLRPHGRKLFHRRGWHRSGGFPADIQLVLAGAILGLLVRPPGWLPGRSSTFSG
jgi:hypothetical protein